MMSFRTALTAVIALVSLTAANASAQAQRARTAGPRRLDDMAIVIRQQARGLEAEFRLQFQHTRQYGLLMADTAEIAGLADRIHDMALRGGDPRRLASDVNLLDRQFRHLEGLVANIERQPAAGGRRGGFHRGQFAQGGFGAGAHGDMRRVNAEMRQMESNIRVLEQGLATLAPRPSVPPQPAPRGPIGQPAPRGPIAQPRSHGGIQIRLPRFSLRIGF